MKQKLFKYILFLFIPITLLCQNSANERLNEMKNSFALGLQNKGLEIASELMSRDEFKDVREDVFFF
jgi:hypothetical protein